LSGTRITKLLCFVERERWAYGVGRGELLLCGDDSSATLRCVQSCLALDYRFAGSSGAATGAAADLSNGVPVFRHVECGVESRAEVVVNVGGRRVLCRVQMAGCCPFVRGVCSSIC
jgi:hypothetical protein